MSWFSLSTLTEQGTKLMDVYTRDISEFASALSSETSQLVTDAASKVKTTIGSIDGAGDEQQQQKMDTHKNKTMIRSLQQSQESFEKRLMELQQDERTYKRDVPQYSTTAVVADGDSSSGEEKKEEDADSVGASEKEAALWRDFTDKFLSAWNVDAYTDKISKLLEENEFVKKFHGELVPVNLTYESFWKHYFYWFERFMEQEERRKKLLQTLVNQSMEDEELEGWDDEEEEDEENSGGGAGLDEWNNELIRTQYNKLKETVLVMLGENDKDDEHAVRLKKQMNDLLSAECPFLFETASSLLNDERKQVEEDSLLMAADDQLDESNLLRSTTQKSSVEAENTNGGEGDEDDDWE